MTKWKTIKMKSNLTKGKNNMQDKQCNECQNEDENDTLYWDNELDKPNMVDYTCLCEPCFIKINKGEK